jgi:hypothetical protein
MGYGVYLQFVIVIFNFILKILSAAKVNRKINMQSKKCFFLLWRMLPDLLYCARSGFVYGPNGSSCRKHWIFETQRHKEHGELYGECRIFSLVQDRRVTQRTTEKTQRRHRETPFVSLCFKNSAPKPRGRRRPRFVGGGAHTSWGEAPKHPELYCVRGGFVYGYGPHWIFETRRHKEHKGGFSVELCVFSV